MRTIPKTMKAMALTAYNELALTEVPVPCPNADEVLCRIRSVAICGSDPKVIEGHYRFANWPPYFPFILGHEWAGEVVALGEDITEFQVGDRVAGEAHCGCGICDNCKKGHYTVCLNYGRDGRDGGSDLGHRHYGFYWQGANAEYNVYKAASLHRIPDGVSFDAASVCDCAGVALHGVLSAGVTPSGTSVIIGPGAIGLCAMQECKALGSGQVIVVGRGKKLKLAKELGADICIDFEKEDPVGRVLELTNGVGADEVMECSGSPTAPMQACQMVRKTGSVAIIATYKEDVVPLPANMVNFNEIRIIGSKANPNVSDQVLSMFASGAIQAEKMISHRFVLEEYQKAIETFNNKACGAVKIVIHP